MFEMTICKDKLKILDSSERDIYKMIYWWWWYGDNELFYTWWVDDGDNKLFYTDTMRYAKTAVWRAAEVNTPCVVFL